MDLESITLLRRAFNYSKVSLISFSDDPEISQELHVPVFYCLKIQCMLSFAHEAIDVLWYTCFSSCFYYLTDVLQVFDVISLSA